MKNFTKIILILAGTLAALGILFAGIGAAMGAGWTTIHKKALAGEFDFGNWHFGDGIYYASPNSGADYDSDDDYDLDDDDYDGVNDHDMEEKHNKNSGHSETAGTENCMESYGFSDHTSIELQMDVASELNIEVSDSSDEITVAMEKGYKKYFSTEKNGSVLSVIYDTRNHYHKNGPKVTITLPKKCENLTIELEVGVGNVSVETKDLKIRELDISVGVGDIDFCGDIAEELSAESGTGNITVELPERLKYYEFDATTGLGEIHVNGHSKGALATEFETDGTSDTQIEIDLGMGDITIVTKKK